MPTTPLRYSRLDTIHVWWRVRISRPQLMPGTCPNEHQGPSYCLGVDVSWTKIILFSIYLYLRDMLDDADHLVEAKRVLKSAWRSICSMNLR